MPALTGSIANNEIVLGVAVSTPNAPGSKPLMCQALLDTGAQVTAISEKLVSKLGLGVIRTCSIVVADGVEIPANVHRIRLDIPLTERLNNGRGGVNAANLGGADLSAAGLPFQSPDYDVIIGMDFLPQFHFAMYGEHFTLSDRPPK